MKLFFFDAFISTMVFESFAVLPVLKILWKYLKILLKSIPLIAIPYPEFRYRTRTHATLLVISSVSLAYGDKVNGFLTTLTHFCVLLRLRVSFFNLFLKSLMVLVMPTRGMYFIDKSIFLKFRCLIAFIERNGAEESFRACHYFEF
jgi:hypothetical protein